MTSAGKEPNSRREEGGAHPALEIDIVHPAARVSGLVLRPAGARRLCVLAHGAGAGMRHPFMESIARRLGARGIATLRFQFPYMESGRRRPDPPHLLHAIIGAAVQAARQTAPEMTIFAGGKSMGGRMASQAAAAGGLPGVRGLCFLGFPLHPAGRPATGRAAHLEKVPQAMLFLQGSRDRLADLELLGPICERLGPRARLEVFEGADHSFEVLATSPHTREEVHDRLAATIDEWTAGIQTGDTEVRSR